MRAQINRFLTAIDTGHDGSGGGWVRCRACRHDDGGFALWEEEDGSGHHFGENTVEPVRPLEILRMGSST
ncbi:unnamed protein product [Taenia asiatica]|uniref:UBP-type domain-containing protein n=1 Tax=Taenia asiatica TaxID=60517 RepID=A0A0R3WB42_TAEAS|nr:unnamed protein product [Taenia asiatica]